MTSINELINSAVAELGEEAKIGTVLRIRLPADFRVAAMNFPWETYVSDSGDAVESVEEVYPQKKIDPKDMSVKADTEEDRERLWKSVVDYASS